MKLLVESDLEQAMETARDARPAGMAVDLTLPENGGWVLLDRLKHDAETRHIPVEALGGKAARSKALRGGAIGHVDEVSIEGESARAVADVTGFLDRGARQLLIVEDD